MSPEISLRSTLPYGTVLRLYEFYLKNLNHKSTIPVADPQLSYPSGRRSELRRFIPNTKIQSRSLLMSNAEIEDKVLNFFKDFMTRVAMFDELVAAGSTFLVGFQQGLEFMRRPPIDQTSELVKSIIRANETKRVQSYIEAGCINTDDGMKNLGLCDHISKGKAILNELECLLEDVNGALQTAIEDSADRLNEEATTDDKEITVSSQSKRIQVTNYAVLIGVIYSMIKQDYMMQERVVSALNLKLSSGELESYCLMWSLRPFIKNEIMDHAWKLIR